LFFVRLQRPVRRHAEDAGAHCFGEWFGAGQVGRIGVEHCVRRMQTTYLIVFLLLGGLVAPCLKTVPIYL
jgi:hypothetical protein